MHLITWGIIRFSVFVVVNALLDVYIFEKPINHYVNFGVAIVVAVGLTYWDYRNKRQENV